MRESTSREVELLDLGSGRLQVRGALTFATARHARTEGLRVISAGASTTLEIDCGAVTHSDSAGLAVLLDWLILARRHGQALRLTNLPAAIRAVAEISDVEPILNQGFTA